MAGTLDVRIDALPGGAGRLVDDGIRREIGDEATRPPPAGRPEDLPELGVRHHEVLPRARDRHVGEAPLLLHLLVPAGLHPAVREHLLFHPGEEHQLELEPLRAVHRHERDARRVLHPIHVALQGHPLQVPGQRGLFAGGARLRLVVRDRREELPQVLLSRVRLGAVLEVERRAVPGPLEHRLEDRVRRARERFGAELGDEVVHAGEALLRGGGDVRRTRPARGMASWTEMPRLDGELRETLERGRPDPATGDVDDSEEVDVAPRVHEHAQVREGVFHLGALVELHPADDLVRRVRRAERLFEDARLGVHSVEDGHLARVDPRGLRFLNNANHVRRFVALVLGGDDFDGRAGFVRRPQLLRHPLARRLDDPQRGLHDPPARAVVLLELHHLGLGEVFPEAADVADVGAAPAVDGLVVVADDAEVAVLLGERAEEAVLRGVRVLELVDQDVVEAATDGVLLGLLAVFEDAEDVENEVLEVDGVRRAELLFVAAVDLLPRLVLVAVDAHVVRPARLLLLLVDAREGHPWGVALLVEVELAEDARDDGLLVRRVVDDEVA